MEHLLLRRRTFNGNKLAMKRIALFGAVLLFVGFALSCKKKKYDNSNAPKLNAFVETSFDEMTNMSDQAMTGNMVYYKMDQVTVLYADKIAATETVKSDCNVVITIDTVSSPKSITIDWGSSNCTCNDGKQRRGKIITTFTGSYYALGTVITHTPVNYYVNDNKIEGTKTVTNMGLNSSAQPYYNVEINGTATMSSGEIVHYTSSRVRTFTDGYTTQAYFWDDEYDITGTANGTVENGDSFDAEITSALHVKVGCPYVTKGVLEITPSGKPTRTIDYGQGTCDGTFTITVNGHTYTVTV